jgi:hypothetical protein
VSVAPDTGSPPSFSAGNDIQIGGYPVGGYGGVQVSCSGAAFSPIPTDVCQIVLLADGAGVGTPNANPLYAFKPMSVRGRVTASGSWETVSSEYLPLRHSGALPAITYNPALRAWWAAVLDENNCPVLAVKPMLYSGGQWSPGFWEENSPIPCTSTDGHVVSLASSAYWEGGELFVYTLTHADD